MSWFFVLEWDQFLKASIKSDSDWLLRSPKIITATTNFAKIELPFFLNPTCVIIGRAQGQV
jgi:hypothetical protein